MRVEDLQLLLRQHPFQPFRLFLSNGNGYDGTHPELAMVGQTTVFVGQAAQDFSIPVYDNFAIIPLLDINNAMPLPSGPPSTGSPRNN